MSTDNICFYGEMTKIIPNYPQIHSLSVPLIITQIPILGAVRHDENISMT